MKKPFIRKIVFQNGQDGSFVLMTQEEYDKIYDEGDEYVTFDTLTWERIVKVKELIPEGAIDFAFEIHRGDDSCYVFGVKYRLN